MKQIDDCLDQALSKILIKQNADFVSPDNYVLADEIIFLLEKSFIRILPIIDTDELVVEYNDLAELGNIDGTQEYLTHFTGKTFSAVWSCKNTNGYSDLFILSFNFLQPSLLILSEGSALALFEAKQLSSNAIMK